MSRGHSLGVRKKRFFGWPLLQKIHGDSQFGDLGSRNKHFLAPQNKTYRAPLRL